MNFQDAVKLCFQKYADFNGRAARPEFWWFFLFCLAGAVVLEFVSGGLSWIFSLATLLPSLAVGSRRLHDTNKSGWLQLIWLIPVSYTHLDVYKRQLLDIATSAFGDEVFVDGVQPSKKPTGTHGKISALIHICLLYTSRCV